MVRAMYRETYGAGRNPVRSQHTSREAGRGRLHWTIATKAVISRKTT